MKKVNLLLISLFMMFTLFGCSSNNEEVVNPIVEYDSLEEINAKLNLALVEPSVMGVSEETYEIIDEKIGQYCFKVNGIAYTMRGAHNPEAGISGIYENEQLLDDLVDESGYVEDSTGKLLTFKEEVGSDTIVYTIYAEDNGAYDKDSFLNIVDELKESIDVDAHLQDLPGEYYDSISERAILTVEKLDETSFKIIVHWSSSATEYTEWTMSATCEESKNLVYSDCVKKNIIVDENGKTTSKEEYKDGSGYFLLDSKGELSWLGASEEDCKSCIFLK